MTMQTLTHSFIVLQYVGLWRPVHWIPGWKSRLYNCYTWIMVFLLVTVTLSELVQLLTSLDNVETFANNSFMLMTMIGMCGKVINVLIKRNEIIELTNVLQQDPCRPNNDDELEIQRKYDNSIRFNTLSYASLVGSAAVFIALTSVMRDVPRRALPYESWLPFDCEESVLSYSLAYNHQIITLLSGAAINVAFDTLVSGLMLQACCQLNILKYRFHTMPQILESQIDDRHRIENRSDPFILKLETQLLSHRVIHHTKIFKFAKTANDLFGVAIFLQCAVSTVVLCVSVFELSKMTPLSAEFTSIMMYLACMLFEIFIYCFSGYELTIEMMPRKKIVLMVKVLLLGKLAHIRKLYGLISSMKNSRGVWTFYNLTEVNELMAFPCPSIMALLMQSVKLGDAVYEMDWNSLSTRTQTSLLTIMVRTLRPIKITTLYIVTLNLDSFNKLLKLSYSAYNVL